MSIIFVAGPYSGGDTAQNVRRAIDRGMQLNDQGHYAVIPHLSHFLHIIEKRPYEYWMALSHIIVPKCDKLIRLPGESPGADREVDFAKISGVEVVIE